MNRIWNDPRLAAACVALAALAVYANSLWNGFAFDDVFIIAQNARVHSLRDQAAIWLTPYWPNYGEEFGLYRPLAIFGYAVQWWLGGGAPWIFHATSVLLHAAVSVLLLRLLLRFLPAAAAFAGALVFAVHPLHSEAVANVVGQAELIAAAATLIACLLHAGRPAGTDVDWARRIAYVVLFLVAVLAKESAIAMPVLLVVLDAAQRRVVPTRASLLRYARSLGMLVFLLGAACVAYLALRVETLGSITGLDAGPGLPYLREEYRLLTAFRAWPEFARLLFFPLDLAADYAPGVVLPTTGLTPMAALGLLLLAATVACAAAIFRAPRAGLAAAWFLVTVLTVSNLLFPIGVLLAERTLYTPSMALSFAVGAAVVAAGRLTRARRRAAVAAFCLGLGLLGARTWIRNPDWASTEAVGRALERDWPEAYRTHWLRAVNFAAGGRLQEAELAWRTAVRIWPRDPALLAGFAEFLMSVRRFDEAVPLLEEAERITPWAGQVPALLARAYLGVGRHRDAIAAGDRAFRRAAIDPKIYFATRARAYEALGDDANAIGAWRAAARQPPGTDWIYPAMLARTLARYGLEQEAARAADAAIARAESAGAAAATTARALHGAIAQGCYRSSHVGAERAEPTVAEGCSDPLARWSLFGEAPLPQPANSSHGATSFPNPGAPTASGRDT